MEDDRETAVQMQRIIEAGGYKVSLAPSLQDARAQLQSSQFALIILDRMLQDGDGVDVLRNLRTAGDNTLLMIVSALGRSQNRIEGLDEGADDYLAKPFDPAELMARIKALMRRREASLSSETMQFSDLQIHKTARTVHRGECHIAISPREFDLLMVFANHAGQLLTRKMLLELVWNLHFDPQTNVVDVHVGRLRRKLDEGGGEPLIHTLRGKGYVFAPADNPVD